jgi:hypothetical protein
LGASSKSAILNKSALKSHIGDLKNLEAKLSNRISNKSANADGDTNNNSFQLINGLNF